MDRITPHIVLCVTSDIIHDQRVRKISTSLMKLPANVTVVGRSKEVVDKSQLQDNWIHLECYFSNGFLFYLEFNLRLLFWLNNTHPDIVIANDTDTLLASQLYIRWKRKLLAFDSHEIFCEVPELEGKRLKKWIWKKIERWSTPYASITYTVGSEVANVLRAEYGKRFNVIRNVPYYINSSGYEGKKSKILIYQGALNVGRGLEESILAMALLPGWELWIVGSGPCEASLKRLVSEKGLDQLVKFFGAVQPVKLLGLTAKATIGLNLLEGESLNYYLSLANKFFDYTQAEIPSINMSFPEYNKHLAQYKVGVTIDTLEPKVIAEAVQLIMENMESYSQEIRLAKEVWIWENEERKLLNLFREFL